jgi:PAS domain S-box-containing protein
MAERHRQKADVRAMNHLADAFGDAWFILDAQQQIIAANPGAENFTRLPHHKLIGLPISSLFIEEWRARIQQLPTGERLEAPLRQDDDEPRWVELVCVEQDDDTRLAVLRDMTEQVRLQANLRRYESLFDQTSDAVFISNIDGIYIGANPRALEMLGYSADELIGQPIRFALAEHEVPDSERVLQDLREGKRLPLYERIFRRKSGEEFPAELNESLVRDENGRGLYIQTIARDVTERRVIEQTLHETLANVEALYTISHSMINADTPEDLLLSYADISSVHPQSAALYYVFYNEQRQPDYIELAVQFNSGAAQLDPHPLGKRYPVNELALWGQLVATQQMITIPNLLDQPDPPLLDAERVARVTGRGVRSLVFVPLISQRGMWVGLVVMGWEQPPHLNPDQLQLYNVAAPQLASLIENRRLYTQAESMLRELINSQQRLQMVINNAPIILFAVDADQRFTLLQGNSRLFSPELIGKSIQEIEAIPAQVYEQVARVLNGESVTAIVDVDETAYEVRYSPLRDAGSISGVIGVATDVTERRRFENQLQRKIEQLTALRHMESEIGDYLNIEYVITMALDAAVRLSVADAGFIGLVESGRLRVAQHIGAAPPDALLNLNTGDVARALNAQKPLLLEGEISDPIMPDTAARIILPLVFRDNPIGVLVLEVRRAGLFTRETLEFIELLMARIPVALDNSRLYQLLQEQLNELQKLEQLKTDMIRIASHDLRNPLATISGYLELMRWDAGKLLPEHRDYLDHIQRALGRMQKITSDILSLERIEETAREGGLDRVDLRELVERAYADMRDNANQKQLQFTLNIPEQPMNVMGDPVQLLEAIVNLIGNAIKYTPINGSVDVSLRAQSDLVVFEVRDSGYGIPEDKQARLFEPFYRVKTRETKTIEGTGLGLHLVKNIVDRHNGAMIVVSEYGKGSTFGFSLKSA